MDSSNLTKASSADQLNQERIRKTLYGDLEKSWWLLPAYSSKGGLISALLTIGWIHAYRTYHFAGAALRYFCALYLVAFYVVWSISKLQARINTIVKLIKMDG